MPENDIGNALILKYKNFNYNASYTKTFENPFDKENPIIL